MLGLIMMTIRYDALVHHFSSRPVFIFRARQQDDMPGVGGQHLLVSVFRLGLHRYGRWGCKE